MDLWSLGAESFTETSLLVLSSISDLLAKRNDFNSLIRQHLSIMVSIFRLKDKVMEFFPPKTLPVHPTQLVSYFNGPGCLDPFLTLFPRHEGVAQAILKAL